MWDKKNGPNKINGKFNMAGQKIGKDIAIDTIKKYKTKQQKSRASVSYGTSSLSLCICNWSILKDGWQEK